MTEGGPYPSFYVPDDGTLYVPGEVVRVDQSSRQAQIVKDERGDHEVIDCRRATELGGWPPDAAGEPSSAPPARAVGRPDAVVMR